MQAVIARTRTAATQQGTCVQQMQAVIARTRTAATQQGTCVQQMQAVIARTRTAAGACRDAVNTDRAQAWPQVVPIGPRRNTNGTNRAT